jgi:hypothetical protein
MHGHEIRIYTCTLNDPDEGVGSDDDSAGAGSGSVTIPVDVLDPSMSPEPQMEGVLVDYSSVRAGEDNVALAQLQCDVLS